MVGPSSDHGSRAASVKAKMDAMREESERLRKQQRFASALSKADERSHTLLDEPEAAAAAAFEDDAEDRILQVRWRRLHRLLAHIGCSLCRSPWSAPEERH